jgi:hypothetical protein
VNVLDHTETVASAYIVLSELLDLESHAVSMVQLMSATPSIELETRLQTFALYQSYMELGTLISVGIMAN